MIDFALARVLRSSMHGAPKTPNTFIIFSWLSCSTFFFGSFIFFPICVILYGSPTTLVRSVDSGAVLPIPPSYTGSRVERTGYSQSMASWNSTEVAGVVCRMVPTNRLLAAFCFAHKWAICAMWNCCLNCAVPCRAVRYAICCTARQCVRSLRKDGCSGTYLMYFCSVASYVCDAVRTLYLFFFFCCCCCWRLWSYCYCQFQC